jgi:hypothetical protein
MIPRLDQMLFEETTKNQERAPTDLPTNSLTKTLNYLSTWVYPLNLSISSAWPLRSLQRLMSGGRPVQPAPFEITALLEVSLSGAVCEGGGR